MKITLKHKDYCDECSYIEKLNTLGNHQRCKIYRKIMLPQDDIFMSSRGMGSIKRPNNCRVDNEAEIKKPYDKRS